MVLERAAKTRVTVCCVDAFTAKGKDLGVNILLEDADLTHSAFMQSLSDEDGASFYASYTFDGIDLDATDHPAVED